jgi:hypothetical protein
VNEEPYTSRVSQKDYAAQEHRLAGNHSQQSNVYRIPNMSIEAGNNERLRRRDRRWSSTPFTRETPKALDKHRNSECR